MNTPPTSERRCMFCNKIRVFEYNRNVFHSECTVCGSRFGKKIGEEDIGEVN